MLQSAPSDPFNPDEIVLSDSESGSGSGSGSGNGNGNGSGSGSGSGDGQGEGKEKEYILNKPPQLSTFTGITHRRNTVGMLNGGTVRGKEGGGLVGRMLEDLSGDLREL